jgi:hypothetical protein
VLDNPYIPHAAEWLAKKRIDNRWDERHPTYRREWLGQWVRDANALVYPYDGRRNVIMDEHGQPTSVLPEGEWRRILGVDLGASEQDASTAFVLVAYRRGHPELYVLRAWKRAGMTPSRIAAELQRVRSEDGVTQIVVDAGGLGGGYVREFNERYGLAVEAEKRHKRAYVEIVAGELLSGVIRLDPFACRDLVDEWTLLQWNEDRSEPDERFLDHCSDAALYALRAARAHYRPEQEGPKPGTAEYLEAEVRRAKLAAEARVRNAKAKEWRRRFG